MAGTKPRAGGERKVAPAPRARLSPCVRYGRASVSNAFYFCFGYFEWLPSTWNKEVAKASVLPLPLGPAIPSVVPACFTGSLGILDLNAELRPAPDCHIEIGVFTR